MTDVNDLHPVQREMLRLETAFDEQGNPPVDECIKQLSGFDGDVDTELDPILQMETHRAAVLARNYYGRKIGHIPTAAEIAAVGFMQGVTFAAAVRALKEPWSEDYATAREAAAAGDPLAQSAIEMSESTHERLDVTKRWAFLAGEGTLSAADVVAWANELGQTDIALPAELSGDARLSVEVAPPVGANGSG